MPRPRSNPLCELGGQWIAREYGSSNLYRFWHDAGTGRTRRQSLGTSNLEAAKNKLAEIVVKGAPKTNTAFLSVVLDSYLDGPLKKKARSRKAAKHAAALMLQCWGPLVRVHSLTEEKQKHFADWSVAKDHRLSYIARNLGVLAAALSFAKLREPKILYGEKTIRETWSLTPKAPRPRFVPTDAQLGRFLSCEALPANAWRYCMIALLTGCRPEAAIDLAPEARWNDANLIDLNPEGRTQNKKHRALVRAPDALTGWLDHWECDTAKLEAAGQECVDKRYTGYASVESIQTAIDRLRIRDDVALPRLSAYSFRHKVVTVLRRAHVSEDEIGTLIGHRRPEIRSTAGYGEWDPTYLANAVAALDAWFLALQAYTTRPLFSQGFPKTIRVRKKKSA